MPPPNAARNKKHAAVPIAVRIVKAPPPTKLSPVALPSSVKAPTPRQKSTRGSFQTLRSFNRSKRRTLLWASVGASMAVIIALWFLFLPGSIDHTRSERESLFASIRSKLEEVFTSRTERGGTPTQEELRTLQDRVFPTLKNVNGQ